MFPIPNAATVVNAANNTPSHLAPRPRSRTYMGPPAISPLTFLPRYFTDRTASAYLVAMPKTPVSHIQSTAPGPPRATAVATPMMLPVPTVAARAVISAPKWLMSPSPSRVRWKERRIALPMYRCMIRRRTVR